MGSSSRNVLLSALALLVAAAALAPIRSVDFFWHLAAGRWMLAHGEILRHDPFRFTSGGAPWVDHEWGFQVLLAAAERAGGLNGGIALRALLVTTAVALLLVVLRRAATPWPAASALAALVVLGSHDRLLLRPELITMACFAALLAILQGSRRPGSRWKAAIAVTLLVVAWVNLHPGALVAVPVAAAFAFGEETARWARARREGVARPEGVPRPWLLPPLAFAALLANPWGVEVLWVPLRIHRALRDLPAYNPDWAPLGAAAAALFGLAVAAAAGLLLVARRRGAAVDAGGLAVAAVLLPLPFLAARHLPLALMSLAVIAGGAAGTLAKTGSAARWLAGRAGVALAVAIALAGAAGLWLAASGARSADGAEAAIASGLFPRAAVDDLARRPGVGPLLNSAAFGGYLLYRFYPPRQIFLDTRNELDPGLLRELAHARGDARAWDALLDRYGIDAALVRYEDRPRPVVEHGPDGRTRVTEHTASSFLFPADRFALVYWDDVAMLFLQRTPQRDRQLGEEPYVFVQPEDWRATLERAAGDPAFRRGVAAELAHKLAQEPGCRRAQAIAATFSAQSPPAGPPNR